MFPRLFQLFQGEDALTKDNYLRFIQSALDGRKEAFDRLHKLADLKLSEQEIQVMMSMIKAAMTLKNANGFYVRGNLYKLGIGGSVNYQAAIRCFKGAVELNHREAMFSLAGIYMSDDDSPPNYSATMRLYVNSLRRFKSQLSYQDICSIYRDIINTNAVSPLAPDIIYELLAGELMGIWNQLQDLFGARLADVRDYIFSLPEDDCYAACKKAVDSNQQLGRLFESPSLSEKFFSIFGDKPANHEILSSIKQRKEQIEEKYMQAVFSTPTNTTLTNKFTRS